jgi:hypothetical protein
MRQSMCKAAERSKMASPPANIAWTINSWSSPVHVAFNGYGRLGFCFFIS